MATTQLLLGIICFAFAGSIRMHDRNLLIQQPPNDASLRARIVHLAQREVGIRELSGKNDGKQIERYLAAVNLKSGQPYCAAFVSFIFSEAGLLQPRSGWSPDMFPPSRLTKSALPANLLGIYFPEYGRIAHVGLITNRKGDWLSAVEGNTNVNGSREGDGVYVKLRHIRTIYRMADWVEERRRIP